MLPLGSMAVYTSPPPVRSPSADRPAEERTAASSARIGVSPALHSATRARAQFPSASSPSCRRRREREVAPPPRHFHERASESRSGDAHFHVDQHLVRFKRRGERAGEEIRRRDPAFCFLRSRPQLPRQRQTMAGISDAGSAWARLPPMVPRLRICGCAICGSASWINGSLFRDRRIAFKLAVARHGADQDSITVRIFH